MEAAVKSLPLSEVSFSFVVNCFNYLDTTISTDIKMFQGDSP